MRWKGGGLAKKQLELQVRSSISSCAKQSEFLLGDAGFWQSSNFDQILESLNKIFLNIPKFPARKSPAPPKTLKIRLLHVFQY
jgi:hypothetical protein